MRQKVYSQQIIDICDRLFDQKVDVELTIPDEQFGDLSTNVAMQLANKLNKNPREIAQKIIPELETNPDFLDVSLAGPGFINLKFTDTVLHDELKNSTEVDKTNEGKTIVCEYSDPNPFKALHAGHLYTTLVGDAIANILETSGANIKRVNFGGDVGLHVAKTLWAVIDDLGGEMPEKLTKIDDEDTLDWLSRQYVRGNSAYESRDGVKKEVNEINARIYKLHKDDDHDSNLAKIYWTCRQWSYDGFDLLYEKLQVKKFDKYYPESATTQLGLDKVKEHTGDIYEKSDGAVIFRAEKYGLFTQVFINNEGLPTYAAKDVGLILLKDQDYHPNISYIITDVAQKDHLAVVMKSIEQFAPELVKNTVHQTHGRITLPGGAKMSSREGNVVMAEDVIKAAQKSAKDDQEEVILGAIRYSFLKNKIGGNIVYDPDESISHEGNSGPYLQYALVRARSILSKISNKKSIAKISKLEKDERSLARKIVFYPQAFQNALKDYSPHHICNYLFELAALFNRFYENNRVIDDPRSDVRTELVKNYEKVLSQGLEVLGMPKPEKM